MPRSFFAAAIAGVALADNVPTAIFHGLGDQCINPGMHHFTKQIREGTGAFTKCIEVDLGAISSILENFDK
jgi:hypothetical protein